MILQKGTNYASNFSPRDAKGNMVEVHSSKIAGGYWDIVLQRYNPKSGYEETIKTMVGYSTSTTVKEDTSLTSEISAKFMSIGSSLKYSIAYGKATTNTWNYQTEKTQKWTVYPGPSVCVFQWVFNGQYDTIKLGFASSIFADTDCQSEPPNLLQ